MRLSGCLVLSGAGAGATADYGETRAMGNGLIKFPQRLETIFKGQKANTRAGDPHQHLTCKGYQGI